jgi:hypothetical protein
MTTLALFLLAWRVGGAVLAYRGALLRSGIALALLATGVMVGKTFA